MSPVPNHSLRGPVTLISGSRGLAEHLIRHFTEAGHQVSVLVRRPEAVAECRLKFPEAFLVEGDAASREACRSWVNRTRETFGHIDCLINNAAVTGPGGRHHEVDFDDFVASHEVNFLAPAYLCQLAIQAFFEQGTSGVVVNLSGGGATAPRPRFAGYATAKCAVVRLTETLAEEYPELRFYAMSPGSLMTPMMEAMLKMDPSAIGSKEYDEAKRRSIEGGDDPSRAAKLAVWLSENRPEHLSGKLISAIWDDYEHAPHFPKSVGWWTLRRVDEVCLKNLKTLT